MKIETHLSLIQLNAVPATGMDPSSAYAGAALGPSW